MPVFSARAFRDCDNAGFNTAFRRTHRFYVPYWIESPKGRREVFSSWSGEASEMEGRKSMNPWGTETAKFTSSVLLLIISIWCTSQMVVDTRMGTELYPKSDREIRFLQIWNLLNHFLSDTDKDVELYTLLRALAVWTPLQGNHFIF